MKLRSLFILLIAVPNLVSGQDDRSPASSLLPDIDPQDIEIRGEFTARFPGIMRQPVLGFNPRQRVFQIDPNRMPFIESRDQIASSLPVGELERPEAPPYSFMLYPNRYRAWSYAGLGNYISPEAGLIAELPFSHRTFLISETRFESSDDHASQPSAYRFMKTNLSLQINGKNHSRWTIAGHARSDFNYLNRVIPPDLTLIPIFTPAMNQQEAGGSISWQKHRNALSTTRVMAYGNYMDGKLTKDVSTIELNEIITGGAFEHSWTTNRPGQYLEWNTSTYHGVATQNNNSGDWGVSKMSLGYFSDLGTQMRIKVGTGIYYGYDNFTKGLVRFYPELWLEYRRAGSFTFTGEISGEMWNDGLSGLTEKNRFVRTFDNSLNQSRLFMRAKARQEFYTGFRMEAGVEVSWFNRYSYFSLDDFQRNFTISYSDRASIVRFFGVTSFDVVPEKLTAFIAADLKNGKIRDGKMPHIPLLGFDFGLNYHPISRINISLWGDFVGKRYLQPNEVTTDAWFALGARVDYRFTRQFGVYLKGSNLLNQSYSPWGVGYGAPPIQAFGGLTLKF